jgi:hypothetical protein
MKYVIKYMINYGHTYVDFPNDINIIQHYSFMTLFSNSIININDRVGYQVLDKAWGQLWTPVLDQVTNYIWHHVWDHVKYQVWNQLRHKVMDQLNKY